MGKKWNYTRFLQELEKQNPKIFNQLTFLEETPNATTNIRALHKYGEIQMVPSSLRRSKEIIIMSAVDKTDFWIRSAMDKRGPIVDYSKVIYKGAKQKVTLGCFIHGEFDILPANFMLATDTGCGICAQEKRDRIHTRTQEQFIQRLQERNPYIFNNCTVLDPYKKDKTPLRIKTPYGIIKTSPSTLWNGFKPTIQQAENPTEYMINGFLEVHGNLYDYTKAQYIDAKSYVTITCKKHGDFKQTRGNHMLGHGCHKCAKEKHVTWGRADYIKYLAGRESCCYIIKCFNEEESFYKIGISVDIKRRFRGVREMPYDYEVLKEFKGSATFVWDKEHELHDLHKTLGLQYKPQIYFPGISECYTDILWDKLNNKGVNT